MIMQILPEPVAERDNSLLTLKNLSVTLPTDEGDVQAVRDLSLTIKKGEIIAIVGESGCGKSLLCRSIMKLLPPFTSVEGQILWQGKNLVDASEKEMRSIRGREFSMLFQDPMSSLNPALSIGKQLVEAIRQHQKMTYKQAEHRAIALLESVGVDHAKCRFSLQPHFFSGGMRQRCVLAIAMASQPKILFADEPTTALDVMVQAKILDLLHDICKKSGVTLVLVSHDLGVVARIADRVAVMYAGKIVEIGQTEEIFYDPRHPYTWGLLNSLPYFTPKGTALVGIPGMPPSLINPPKGDAFAQRNPYAMAIDYQQMPRMYSVSPTHQAATWLLDPKAPKITPPVNIIKRRSYG